MAYDRKKGKGKYNKYALYLHIVDLFYPNNAGNLVYFILQRIEEVKKRLRRRPARRFFPHQQSADVELILVKIIEAVSYDRFPVFLEGMFETDRGVGLAGLEIREQVLAGFGSNKFILYIIPYPILVQRRPGQFSLISGFGINDDNAAKAVFFQIGYTGQRRSVGLIGDNQGDTEGTGQGRHVEHIVRLKKFLSFRVEKKDRVGGEGRIELILESDLREIGHLYGDVIFAEKLGRGAVKHRLQKIRGRHLYARFPARRQCIAGYNYQAAKNRQ